MMVFDICLTGFLFCLTEVAFKPLESTQYLNKLIYF